jgi:hypothetical protein
MYFSQPSLHVTKMSLTLSVYFQVKNQTGKTGWYKDPKKWSENSKHFNEARYAG